MNFAMNFAVIDAGLVVKLLLLLLIGMGPKVALVPFLEKTKHLDAETQRAVGRRMVVTAVVTAIVLFATGWLLLLNDQHLDEKARDEFETHLEKVVDVSSSTSLRRRSPRKLARVASGMMPDAKSPSAAPPSASRTSGRSSGWLGWSRRSSPKLAHYDPEVLRAAIASLALFCWCRDNPDAARRSTAASRAKRSTLFSTRATTQRERKARATTRSGGTPRSIHAYGYMWPDKFDFVLMEAVRKGYSTMKSLPGGAKQSAKFAKGRLEGSFEAKGAFRRCEHLQLKDRFKKSL